MKRVRPDNRRCVLVVQRLRLPPAYSEPVRRLSVRRWQWRGIDGEIAIRTLCSAQGYFVTGHLKFVSGKKIDAARVSIHTVRQDDIC